MATVVDNVIQYTIKAKDEFTSALSGVTQKAKGIGPALVEGLTVGAAAFNGFVKAGETAADILGGNYARLGDVFRSIPGPVGEAAASIASFAGTAVMELTKAADKFDKLSQKTGASIEFVSQFTEAADDVRVSAESVEGGLTKFARALGGVVSAEDGAVAGGKPLAQTLKDIGLNVEDANGKLRSMEEILPQVADLFQSMPDGAQKTALAVQLFGRNGAELIPILNKGALEMKAMMKQSEELGTALNTLDKEAMTKIKQRQDEINDRMKAFEMNVARQVLPVLSDLTYGLMTFGEAQATWLGLDSKMNVIGWADAYADSFDRVAKKTYDVAGALPKLGRAGPVDIEEKGYSNTISQQKQLEDAGRKAADAQKLLADQINNLKSALSTFPATLTPLKQLEEVMGITGSGKSLEQFGKEQFIGAIGQARDQKKLTNEQAVTFLAEVTTTGKLSEDSIKAVGQAAVDAAKNLENVTKLVGSFREQVAGRTTPKTVEADMGLNVSPDQMTQQTDALRANVEQQPYTLTFREEGLGPIKSVLDSIPTEKTVTVRVRGVAEGGSEAERLAAEEERLRLMRSNFAAGGPR